MKDGIEQLNAELAPKALEVLSIAAPNTPDLEGLAQQIVRAVTVGWRATKEDVPLLHSGGYVHDGDTVPDPGDEPGTGRMVAWSVKTAPRPLNEQEQAEQDQVQTLRDWLRGDQQTEPPVTIGLEDLMDQSRWWVTKDKQVMRLRDMAPSHRANLLALLERNALGWQDAINNRYLLNAPDGVWEEFERELAQPDEVRRKAARKWLHSKPLVKKLRKLVKADTILADADADD